MQDTVVASVSNYVEAKRISLKKHPTLNEKWVQALIANQPTILGLGDLNLVAKELKQPSGGRLDLLLESADGDRSTYFEVEVQLGATDPSHIMRTIEYWDVERMLRQGSDHIAVLVAEDITSRFLNLISVLNKSVPLIALQMQAFEVGACLTVVFTTVVDLAPRRDLRENDIPETANRSYWEIKAKSAMPIVDELFELVHALDKEFQLKYNQNFIQINKAGRIFLSFTPTRYRTRIRIRMEKTSESEGLRAQIEVAGTELEYSESAKGGASYLLLVDNEKFSDQSPSIRELIKLGLQNIE